MNDRLQALKQRSAASHQSVQTTLQKTAPKATLGGIKAAAEKKFGPRKPRKKQQPKPKQNKPKQPKAVRSDVLDQWKKAMEHANIPRDKWENLEDKISRLSGADRKEIEEVLFEHQLFEDVYWVGDKEIEVTDDYLKDLEDKINRLNENIKLD